MSKIFIPQNVLRSNITPIQVKALYPEYSSKQIYNARYRLSRKLGIQPRKYNKVENSNTSANTSVSSGIGGKAGAILANTTYEDANTMPKDDLSPTIKTLQNKYKQVRSSVRKANYEEFSRSWQNQQKVIDKYKDIARNIYTTDPDRLSISDRRKQLKLLIQAMSNKSFTKEGIESEMKKVDERMPGFYEKPISDRRAIMNAYNDLQDLLLGRALADGTFITSPILMRMVYDSYNNAKNPLFQYTQNQLIEETKRLVQEDVRRREKIFDQAEADTWDELPFD